MTNYQLAKLILMADGIDSRKRIQKTVHLLQAAGCDFALTFRLHHYGPYSAELAENLDRMATTELLVESTQQTSVGKQYAYRVSDSTRKSLETYEASEAGQAAAAELEPYRPLFFRLKGTSPRALELASTLVAYHQGEAGWDRALQATADFKREPRDSAVMLEALQLAQSIVA